MSVSCECCVLSGGGLCDGLITRPEESYHFVCACVCVCDLETSRIRRSWPALGCSIREKKINTTVLTYILLCISFKAHHKENILGRSIIVYWRIPKLGTSHSFVVTNLQVFISV